MGRWCRYVVSGTRRRHTAGLKGPKMAQKGLFDLWIGLGPCCLVPKPEASRAKTAQIGRKVVKTAQSGPKMAQTGPFDPAKRSKTNNNQTSFLTSSGPILTPGHAPTTFQRRPKTRAKRVQTGAYTGQNRPKRAENGESAHLTTGSGTLFFSGLDQLWTHLPPRLQL